MTGSTVNIPDVYADARFNPEVDRRTGYRTRNMLCMPLRDESGETVGVMQVLNKQHGAFTEEDESLLNALGSQTAIALQNSRLFEQVQYMRNYNDAILRTMATGVVTVGAFGDVEFCNAAARQMFGEVNLQRGVRFSEFFDEELNSELVSGIDKVFRGEDELKLYQYRFTRTDGEEININAHAMPLRDSENKPLGVVVVADDITQEQKLMSTLCRYVTRQVAEKVLKDRDKLKLGGTRSEVTVLFSDIRNFTTISEASEAEEIVGMLNDYFSRMAEPIFKYDGVLDKFIGDAIMAHFGALVAREDHAVCAVRAALEMRHALRRYNRSREIQGRAPIEIGIGITKGDVIHGNIGSEQRLDYTVIGDTVNVASRLEGLTKQYDCKILINESVYNDVCHAVRCVDLGWAQVKGKGERIHIFGVADPEEQRKHERYAAAFDVSYGISDHLLAGHAVDVSEGGLGITGAQTYPPGTELEVHCRLNGDWIKTHVVVRCLIGEAGQQSMGVQFVKLGETERLAIREYIRAQQASGRASALAATR